MYFSLTATRLRLSGDFCLSRSRRAKTRITRVASHKFSVRYMITLPVDPPFPTAIMTSRLSRAGVTQW